MDRLGQLNLRVSEEDRRMLGKLADHYNVSGSGVLRMLLKRDFDELELDRPIEPRPPLRLADIPRGPKVGGRSVAVPLSHVDPR